MHPNSSKDAALSASASSAPGSRPLSGGAPLTARPGTARQRSLSALSNHSDSPRSTCSSSSDAALAASAASTLSSALLSAPASAALSSSSSSAPDSARQQAAAAATEAVLRTLRIALAEEQQALLQDVAYLQECLETEIDAAVEDEMLQQQHQQQRKGSQSSAATTSAVEDDAPASVPELRALNDQLKAALQAEEVRSHTLAIMGSVATNHSGQQPQLSSPLASPSPLTFRAGSTGAQMQMHSQFGKSPSVGPLKAVRIPSPSRVRGSPGPIAALAGPGGSPHFSPLASPSFTELQEDGAPPVPSFASRMQEFTTESGAAAISVVSPSAADLDLQQLLAQNADLFSDGPVAAVTDASAAAAPPQQKPVIPTLALGSLQQQQPARNAVDHFPPAPAAAFATSVAQPAMSPARPSSGEDTLAMAAHSRAERPMTARSASKVRSRIQAAQNFDIDA